jgi:phosphoglucosamine mutase
LGRAAAYVFAQLNPRRTPDGARPKIVLGKDTRLSGYMLENALVAGITSLGVDVLVIGPLPTPGVAYITRSLRADAGIVPFRFAQSLSGQRYQIFPARRLQAG